MSYNPPATTIPVDPALVRALGSADDALVLAVITQAKATADAWVRFTTADFARLTGLGGEQVDLSLERLRLAGHIERQPVAS